MITDIVEFQNSQSQWNSLVGDRLFHSWEWLFSWWETWQDRGQLAIVVILDPQERWVGVAPLFKEREKARGCVLKTIGCGAACSDYVSIATRPGFERVVAQQIYDLTLGKRSHFSAFADVDLFEVEGHSGTDHVMLAIADLAKQDEMAMVVDEIGGTWRARLDFESWEQFEKSLAKSFRRKTKKAVKRLTSEEFEGRVFWSDDDLEEFWPTFVDLHQRRRKFLGQEGCFADSKFENFLKQATLRLARSAKAQINMVFHKGKPLTTNLEFISADSVYMYQTGMDPDWLNLEPGHLTFAWAIRESIDRSFRWFDFLRGDEPYKARWNAERVSLYRTRIVPNRWKAQLRNRIWTTGRDCKRLAKSLLHQWRDRKDTKKGSK